MSKSKCTLSPTWSSRYLAAGYTLQVTCRQVSKWRSGDGVFRRRPCACLLQKFSKIINKTDAYSYSTRMWADAQRDGPPAEYRWRPLHNAAKFFCISPSHPGQLSLLPSAELEMSTRQSAVMLCGWEVKAGSARMVHSTCG